MLLRAAALLAAALAAGCSGLAVGTLEEDVDAVHPSFDPARCGGHWHVDRASFERNAPEGLDAIDASPASWTRFTAKPGSLSFDEVPGPSCTIRALLAREVPFETATGRYNPRTGDVTLVIDRMPACADAPAWAGSCLGPVILHEIGHGMGIPHIELHERGIMHENTMNSWFTAADRRVCEKAGACAPDPTWRSLGEKVQ